MDLFASTSGTDSDWVVKLIDVYPDEDAAQPELGGYQLGIGMDIFRGRYRDSLEHPTAIPSGAVQRYQFALPSVDHVFLPGHRIMVQVQSAWFPLYDRNPPDVRRQHLLREAGRLRQGDAARVPRGRACVGRAAADRRSRSALLIDFGCSTCVVAAAPSQTQAFAEHVSRMSDVSKLAQARYKAGSPPGRSRHRDVLLRRSAAVASAREDALAIFLRQPLQRIPKELGVWRGATHVGNRDRAGRRAALPAHRDERVAEIVAQGRRDARWRDARRGARRTGA